MYYQLFHLVKQAPDLSQIKQILKKPEFDCYLPKKVSGQKKIDSQFPRVDTHHFADFMKATVFVTNNFSSPKEKQIFDLFYQHAQKNNFLDIFLQSLMLSYMKKYFDEGENYVSGNQNYGYSYLFTNSSPNPPYLFGVPKDKKEYSDFLFSNINFNDPFIDGTIAVGISQITLWTFIPNKSPDFKLQKNLLMSCLKNNIYGLNPPNSGFGQDDFWKQLFKQYNINKLDEQGQNLCSILFQKGYLQPFYLAFLEGGDPYLDKNFKFTFDINSYNGRNKTIITEITERMKILEEIKQVKEGMHIAQKSSLKIL